MDGRGVHGDPVAGLARRAPQELPGALRVGAERALEQAEREPARLEAVLAEQPVGDEEQRGGPDIAGRAAEAAGDRRHQRPADAVDGADPRGDPLLPVEVLRVGEGPEAGHERRGEGVGVVDVVRQAGAEGLGAGLCSATKATARAVTGLVVADRRSWRVAAVAGRRASS